MESSLLYNALNIILWGFDDIYKYLWPIYPRMELSDKSYEKSDSTSESVFEVHSTYHWNKVQ